MRHKQRGSLLKVLTGLVVLASVLVSMAGTGQLSAMASHSAASRSAALKNVGPFVATVYYGPDKGLSLRGLLKLRATKDGELTGLLVPTHGPAVLVSGQLNGVAINLVFYMGGGKHVFGVGTFAADPGAKHGILGGSLVGPNKGDSGEWQSTAYYIGYGFGIAAGVILIALIG